MSSYRWGYTLHLGLSDRGSIEWDRLDVDHAPLARVLGPARLHRLDFLVCSQRLAASQGFLPLGWAGKTTVQRRDDFDLIVAPIQGRPSICIRNDGERDFTLPEVCRVLSYGDRLFFWHTAQNDDIAELAALFECSNFEGRQLVHRLTYTVL